MENTSEFSSNLAGVPQREDSGYAHLLVAYIQTALAEHHRHFGVYPQRLEELKDLDWPKWKAKMAFHYERKGSAYRLKLVFPGQAKAAGYPSPERPVTAQRVKQHV